MTSSSWAPRARPSPERARAHRGPDRCGTQIACATSRRSCSAPPSTSRSASARISPSRASSSPPH
eukprot:55430-Alexandrium_andersonii.AAC.1